MSGRRMRMTGLIGIAGRWLEEDNAQRIVVAAEVAIVPA